MRQRILSEGRGALLIGLISLVAIGAPYARAQTYTILHEFAAVRGARPLAGVIMDAAGNLYGTTSEGGNVNVGVAYKFTTSGTVTLLHNFSGGADGGIPESGLISDGAGSLYGTASRGGLTTGTCAPVGCGVVYKIDKAKKQTILYTFTGGNDGGVPIGGLVRDSAGNLYGTTEFGGTGGQGVVFKLDTSGNETVLYSFTGGADGGGPLAGLVRDAAGNLYGTTLSGGTTTGICAQAQTFIPGCGVVFKVDPTNRETVLYRFSGGMDGGGPQAALALDASGNLYGTATGGGHTTGICASMSNLIPGCGVVFEQSAAGKYQVLYAFSGSTDGSVPISPVNLDSAGNLYGTTEFGGAFGGTCGSAGCGVVYKLATTLGESVLHSFDGRDGVFPFAGLFADSAGNFYGTTYDGGQAGSGVIFKLTP